MDNLYEDLITKYPSLFPKGYRLGIACGPGWYPLISLLCQNINDHVAFTRKARADGLRRYRAICRASKSTDSSILARYYRRRHPTMSDGYIAHKVEQDLSVGYDKDRIPASCSKVEVQQVKEKFGTLRFYTHGADDTVYGMISMAESLSSVICEECGCPGTQGGKHWIKTLCANCRTKQEENNE